MSQVILTNHAKERLQQRQLSVNWLEETVLHPESSRRGKQPGTSEFSKKFGPNYVSVVAHKNQNGEWIVISAWVDPPVSGTPDWYRRQRYLIYKDAPWWKKIVLLILKQLGIWQF